jgi:hypothetical protein
VNFRLFYRGPLKSNGTSRDKHELRRRFHQQLAVLWSQTALAQYGSYIDPKRMFVTGDICLLKNVGAFRFSSLISGADGWHAVAKIDVLFLRPSNPGEIVKHGGDLDNRMKTLLDALRIPSEAEIPPGEVPHSDEIPFNCLLEDDALITELTVRTDRLLVPASSSEVELVVHVTSGVTQKTMGNDIVW